MTDRLKDKAAIVTGGGTGIGKAIAVTFAAQGAKVAICGRRQEPLDKTVSEIQINGGSAIALQCDVSQADQIDALVGRTVETFGKLDILVNNAGVRASVLTIEQLTDEEWQRTFDIDAKGTWLCSRRALPEMRKAGGGSIVMVSSISAHIGQPRQGCYNAAKAAQEQLMKCMALDFAKDNIRVNSICPAWVITEMNRGQVAEMKANPEKLYPPGLSYLDLMERHPIGRIGEPEDCAWAAVYLASEESSWVTGSSLMVDGGYTCQ